MQSVYLEVGQLSHERSTTARDPEDGKIWSKKIQRPLLAASVYANLTVHTLVQ
jgi:hypothetical protein